MLNTEDKVACLNYLIGLLMANVAKLTEGVESEEAVLAALDRHWEDEMSSIARRQIDSMDIGTFLQDFN